MPNARERKRPIRREERVSRTYRLPLSKLKLKAAQRALGAATATEAIERALDLAVSQRRPRAANGGLLPKRQACRFYRSRWSAPSKRSIAVASNRAAQTSSVTECQRGRRSWTETTAHGTVRGDVPSAVEIQRRL